jgi:hypothetical protein
VFCEHLYTYLYLFVFECKQAKDVKDPRCGVQLLVAGIDSPDREIPRMRRRHLSDIPSYETSCVKAFDLVPLLRLCKAKPNIRIRASMPRRRASAKQLDLLLDIKDNDRWWAFMEKAVIRINLRGCSRTICVEIMVKSKYGEEWIGGHGDAKRAWLRERGLDWPKVSVDVVVDS